MAIGRVVLDFERLDVYQRALELVVTADAVAPGFLGIRRHLGWQLHKAASSVPLNIAEGCGRSRRLDRARFFVIATGSAMECAAILDIADRLNVGPPAGRIRLRGHIEAVVAMLIRLTTATRGGKAPKTRPPSVPSTREPPGTEDGRRARGKT